MPVATASLKDVVCIADTGTWGSEADSAWGVPVLRSSNIQNGGLTLEGVAWRELPAKQRATKRLADGDLIVTMSSGSPAHIGKCCIFRQPLDGRDYYFSNFTLRLRARPDIADPRWLFHWLSSPGGRSVLDAMNSTTSGLRNLSRSLYLGQKIPLPPLPEQRRIAAILDKADAVRRKRQQTLVLADQFLHSAFLDMFGDPVTNPKRWEIVRLLEVSTRVTDGTHQPPTWSESGIPFLFISNIVGGRISFDTRKFISRETWEQLTRRCPIEINDILYTTVGSYGNAAIVDTSRQFAFQRHIAHIKPDTRRIHPEFLVGLLQSPSVRMQATEAVRGIAQKTLNLEDLKRFRVFLPSMAEQERYVRLRRQALEHGAALEAAGVSAQTLLSSLVQRAFRGNLEVSSGAGL